jgi:hypothetical protein
MKDHVNEYLANNRIPKRGPTASVRCTSSAAASMSVQALEWSLLLAEERHRSLRHGRSAGGLAALEGAEELRQADENPDRKDKVRVFTWVPVSAVNAEIERRGGIA